MNDYKRLVSYLYFYDDGKKQKNSGFAKIDARNHICKIHISIRMPQVLSYPAWSIYLFYRKENKIKGILLDEVRTQGIGLEMRRTTKSDDIEHSGIALEQIAGVYICPQGNLKRQIFASQWDEKEIIPEDFEVHTIDASEEPKAASVENPVVEIMKKYIEDNQMDVDEAELESESVACDAPMREETETLVQNETDTALQDESGFANDGASDFFEGISNTVENENKTSEDMNSTTESGKSSRKQKRGFEPGERSWNKLYKKYPKILGENDLKNLECIRIYPKDLEILPEKYWELGKNVFLLHGYYYFRHLLLAKNGEKYILGVPGVYHQSEKMVASLFGFYYFLEGKQPADSKGTFGYWCMEIEFE